MLKKILKNILLITLLFITILMFCILLLFPNILSYLLNNDKYMLLYMVNLPITLGIIFTYIDKNY